MNYVTKVAGVTFEGRQEILARVTKNMPCRLEPEPGNPYDSNAVAVKVATEPGKVEHVGYVPKNLAAIIAPHLQGESVMVQILEITGGFETSWGDTAALGMRIAINLPDSDLDWHHQD